MKRTTLYISAALALAFALAGCTKEDAALLSEASEDTPIVFTATGLNPAIETTGATAASRATVDGDWDGVTSVAVRIGGEVKVYDVTADAADNTRATLSRENDPFYWKNSNDITASAWWPYDADDIAQMPAVVVREDQSEWANFAASDHISADEQSVTYGAPTLHFTHRTALVHIVLTEYTAGLESVRLTGLSTEGGNPGIIIPYDKGNHTYSALVLPQEVPQGTAFIACTFAGGKTFGYRMQESVEWTAGEEYTYTVSLAAADPGYTYNEATNTYEVYNANGLLAWNEAARNDLTLNCTLAADITMTGIDWTPVGYFDYENWQDIRYTGTFDGGGHTITGLTADLPNQEHVGLIGCLGGGKVQNLTLAEVEINGRDRVGGVAGENYGTVTGCTVSGNVSGDGAVGGVAGQNYYGTVTGCHATGKVTGNDAVGGVAGVNNNGTVTGCYATGDISGNGTVGGVVGATSGIVTGCYATGDVTGNNRVGGVVGWNSGGTVTGCYATGNVSGNTSVGGVAGYNAAEGTVTGCYWSVYDGNVLDAGIGGGSSGEATKVDGQSVTWQTAVAAMNAALSGKGWQYELKDGNSLPALKKEQ